MGVRETAPGLVSGGVSRNAAGFALSWAAGVFFFALICLAIPKGSGATGNR
jgi:hypothetical protein